jgi:histidine ammonia-lyase
MSEVRVDGRGLTVDNVDAVARGAGVVLCPDAVRRMAQTVRWLSAHQGADVVRSKWSPWMGKARPEEVCQIFIEDHCSGVGDPMPRAWVRAMMLARANVLATGHTGCRPEVAELLLEMLRQDVIPVVPRHGDVGAAGSVPLAHVARVAFRYGGEAWREGERCSAQDAMRGLPELVPNEKEALSLINGSSFSSGVAALAVVRSRRVLDALDAAAALSMEVVRADLSALNEAALEARAHEGAMRVAARLRQALEGSSLVSHRREPDSFSIRCTPVVHGSAWEVLESIEARVNSELNAASDNPLVMESGLVETGAFHGAPIALACDQLKAALAMVAGISERRTFRLTYGQLSGLPSFLVPNSGVDSGLMLAQYTAASLVSEAKALSHPASVDNIPTVQHQEDHVSMAAVSVRTAMEVVELVADVVAIELLSSAQGLDLRMREGASAGAITHGLWAKIREHVEVWEVDRTLHPDLQALGSLVRDGAFVLPRR